MRTWAKTFEALFQSWRIYLRQNWQKALQIRERMPLNEEAFHLLMACGVGVIGGVVNLFFYLSVERVQVFLVGHAGHNIVEVAELMNWHSRLLTPALGGLAAGLILFWGLRFAGKRRSANILEVVVAGDGRLPFRQGVIQTISSMVSIGTGASIGREGGITQLSSTIASKVGQLANWQPYRLRLLVACGASAGISAAYNAPITGAVFAAHIVLGNFSMNLFAPLLCSSVVATMVSRSFFGVKPWYQVPVFEFTNLWQLPWFLALGLLAGVLGALFLILLKRSEDLFKQVKLPYVRMALGGLAVGGLAIAYPEVWGNGYVVANRMLQEPWKLQFLAGIFLAKLFATACSVGSGTVGGVFTPTLFMGAGLGSIFGMLLESGGIAPAHLPIGIFALVGMGAVLSATTRSPLLAIIMIFEISLNYSLMPALMLACAVSTLVSRGLHPHSIYEEPLRLRSLEVESYRLGTATEKTIGDMMRKPVDPIRENTTVPEIAERFLGSANNFLPVVDAEQRFVGLVALQDLKEHLNAGHEMSAVIAMDVMRAVPPCLLPRQKLLEALPILLASELQNVPVINTKEGMKLVGSVRRAEALGLLSEAISAGTPTIASSETTMVYRDDWHI